MAEEYCLFVLVSILAFGIAVCMKILEFMPWLFGMVLIEIGVIVCFFKPYFGFGCLLIVFGILLYTTELIKLGPKAYR